MRVQIYVQKKEADQHFTLAADIDPAFFGLQETLQEVVAKATFHEWSQVAMKFVYPEAVTLGKPMTEEQREQLEVLEEAVGFTADSAHDMTPTPAQEAA